MAWYNTGPVGTHLVVEVSLDQEIRTQAGYTNDLFTPLVYRLAKHLPSETLFPLWA